MKAKSIKKMSLKINNLFFFNFPLILLFIILLSCGSLFAQNIDHRKFYPEIDSLENLLATNPPTGEKLAATYYDLSLAYSETNIDKSMEYAGKCLNTAILINDCGYTAFAYGMLGLLNYYISQYDSAIVYYNKALEAIERMRDYPQKYMEDDVDDEFSKNCGNLGNLFNIQGDYHKAIDCYQKALTVFKKYNWIGSQSMVYKNIGEMYMAIDNYEEAEINLTQSDSLSHIRNDSLRIASVKLSFGRLYLYKKEYAKALQNAEIAYGYYISHPEEGIKKAESLNILADIYLEGYNNWTRATEYAQNALLLLNGLDSPREEAISWRIISTLHLKRKQWHQAEQMALKALATDDSEPANTLALYGILCKAYAQLGNPAKSNEYFDKHKELQSSWSTKHYQSSIREMEVKYETEKKNLEIVRQQNVIASQNMQRWLLAGGVAVCVVFLVLLWYMLRLRTRRNHALAEHNHILSEMNTTKDKFFNIISHDLKNPAVALLDALKLLAKNGQHWDIDTLTEYYSELLYSAEGHVELIFHLLNWAKAQTGRITCKPEKFDLASHIRFDVSQIRNIAAKKDVTLDDIIADDVLILGDSLIITTVVRNLLTNAVKFTPADGTVTLSAESTSNGRYIIAVSDTGIGMTKEQISNLYHLDSAQSQLGTAGEQGTGLGLIVCRDLLDKHGSALHIESEEGKGSKFWFEV